MRIADSETLVAALTCDIQVSTIDIDTVDSHIEMDGLSCACMSMFASQLSEIYGTQQTISK